MEIDLSAFLNHLEYALSIGDEWHPYYIKMASQGHFQRFEMIFNDACLRGVSRRKLDLLTDTNILPSWQCVNKIVVNENQVFISGNAPNFYYKNLIDAIIWGLSRGEKDFEDPIQDVHHESLVFLFN